MTALYKVRTVYQKKDVLRMQKLANEKTRRMFFIAAVVALVASLVLLYWSSTSEGQNVAFFGISAKSISIVLAVAVVASMVLIVLQPYHHTRKILKDKKDQMIKANFYFYKKGFQYGWGDNYRSISYKQVRDYREMEDGYFFQSEDVVYCVKKEVFERGDSMEFSKFMDSVIKQPSQEKKNK